MLEMGCVIIINLLARCPLGYLFYMSRLKSIIKLPVLELFYEILKISTDFTAGSPFTIFLFHKLETCANCSNLISLSLFKR